MEYPDFFAKHYDFIYHQIRDGVDNDFFLKKIKAAKGKVLEIGVGTGRFFKEALNTGANIYGIDVSPAMLSILEEKLKPEEKHRISIGNIVDFSSHYQFDLIIAPFRVMMHVQEKQDQIRALNNVYRHLNPGGTFIFDVFIPDLNQLIKGLENKMDFEGEYAPGKTIRRIVGTEPDMITQTIHVHFTFEFEENGQKSRKQWSVPMRFFFRYELEHLVERSDFEQYQIVGDYNGNPLSQDSKEFIVICEKQAGI